MMGLCWCVWIGLCDGFQDLFNGDVFDLVVLCLCGDYGVVGGIIGYLFWIFLVYQGDYWYVDCIGQVYYGGFY